jgi:DNA repair exonuclease SbcCD ATPase subunit
LINESNTLNELIDVDKESNKLDEYTTISTQLKSLHYKFNNLSFMRKILSDDGIKNYIIKKVIKYWNMKVNSYLSEMNVNFSIQFDENLDSVLKSRNRNCYSYHNFSGGERSRIDVAILLSMLDLSRLQNNIDLNLMVIDELFDSAIDTNGREEILNLFKNKSVSENKSIYVISHSSDLPTELFDKEITIYKKNGFTYV